MSPTLKLRGRTRLFKYCSTLCLLTAARLTASSFFLPRNANSLAIAGHYDPDRNVALDMGVPPLQPKIATVKGIRSVASRDQNSSDSTIVRRSTNYKPTIWYYDYIQSLKSEYVGVSYTRKLAELKGEVTMMFHKVLEHPKQLDLVDFLQRLGVSYHFEDDIRRILKKLCNTSTHDGDVCKNESLYTTALEFRLLRQNGYNVPQEIFSDLKNEKGNFKECLCDDVEGILAFYEASFLLIESESIMEEARNFATKHLKEYVNQSNDQNLCARVNHALELPLHWRMPRLEARWFIDAYRSKEDTNSILHGLAKLDFNMAQTVHQDDLKEGSTWWRHTGLGDLSFARYRLMENFLWRMGVSFQPRLGYNRRVLTKVNALITTIDDVYDVKVNMQIHADSILDDIA
ncbi:myrcene synthase, chloroplastic-like [Juglans regia]|uniref:Myrcene synthase, chloroplastic-like n=1 Tax=Juglans regia TaxID=51240 RepID=A0A2I4EP93_JUGRE|nr:myrcene synthase, chloroplastic-like [Juglans regia]